MLRNVHDQVGLCVILHGVLALHFLDDLDRRDVINTGRPGLSRA